MLFWLTLFVCVCCRALRGKRVSKGHSMSFAGLLISMCWSIFIHWVRFAQVNSTAIKGPVCVQSSARRFGALTLMFAKWACFPDRDSKIHDTISTFASSAWIDSFASEHGPIRHFSDVELQCVSARLSGWLNAASMGNKNCSPTGNTQFSIWTEDRTKRNDAAGERNVLKSMTFNGYYSQRQVWAKLKHTWLWIVNADNTRAYMRVRVIPSDTFIFNSHRAHRSNNTPCTWRRVMSTWWTVMLSIKTEASAVFAFASFPLSCTWHVLLCAICCIPGFQSIDINQ